MTLYIASDHAGFQLKEHLLTALKSLKPNDLGTFSDASVDYPDFIPVLIHKILETPKHQGILICGSGIGMCIGANRYKGIRAMVAHDPKEVQIARAHNDINILCLAGRTLSLENALVCIKLFMNTPFEHGRHLHRLEKIDLL